MNKSSTSLVLVFGTTTVALALALVAARPTIKASTAIKQQFPLRQFYLTPGTFDGATALTACTAGYHMASIFEILDVSNLRYNTTLGLTTGDSGSGPPVANGWIRTGFGANDDQSSVFNTNCNAWTENAGFGTDVFLPPNFNSVSNTRIGPWLAESTNCSVVQSVWCVQD